MSWKRLDDSAMSTVDKEVLWAARDQLVDSTDSQRNRFSMDARVISSLPQRSQNEHRSG
jgi:hypothetical protein